MSEWQPIETAPRDGTPILAYNSMLGSYNTAYLNGEFPCGFWGRLGQWYPQPTHWMPLPPPPARQEDER